MSEKRLVEYVTYYHLWNISTPRYDKLEFLKCRTVGVINLMYIQSIDKDITLND